MALYEFSCSKCGLKFEELVNKTDITQIACIRCGEQADKQMSTFAPVIAGGTPVETIDMTVGRDAENRRKQNEERQNNRRKNYPLKKFDTLPQTKDGKYMPVMALGKQKDVELRKDYVEALQNHRKERTEKGIPQFNEMGAF
jgi:putative FmdB family regulatory protein